MTKPTHPLTALRPENPIAWMAACGVVRLLPGARLRWQDGVAELEYDTDPVQALASLPQRRQKALEIVFPHPLRQGMPPEAWDTIQTLPPDWSLAIAGQKPGDLHVSNLKIAPGGASDMAANARKVLDFLLRHPAGVRDKIQEALFGPWRYEDQGVTGWGWDAAARLERAYVSKDPENITKWGVSGAYWLAYEALPLFPVIHGRTQNWNNGLNYATWGEWLDRHDISVLMLGLESFSERDARAQGVMRWHAKYLRTHKSSGRLAWAAPLARTRSDGQNPGGSRAGKSLNPLII